jgi:prepilin-type processing-associated H-X9-DG protein
MMYVQDYDETFPYYSWGMMSCSEVGTGGSSISGDLPQFRDYSNAAWCNSIQPYVKNIGVFQDPSDKLQLQTPYCINFPQSNFKPGTQSWKKSTWISYGWAEGMSGKKLAALQNPANDLVWSDYGVALVDAWDRYGWTDDLYMRRTIWSDISWGATCGFSDDPRNLQTPFTEEQWDCMKKGTRHEDHVNISFADGHVKLIPSREVREVGPDTGQIFPSAGSIKPKF